MTPYETRRERKSAPLSKQAKWRRRAGAAALSGVLLGVLACGPRAEQNSAPASIPARALALTHVTVIDVSDGTLRLEQTVLIDGTRVRAVGPAVGIQVPAGAQVIDARGQYLIPGLWDMHVHIMGFPEVFYPLLIANGVTGIRDMGTAIPLDTVHQWQQEVAQGTRVGPRQLNAGNPLGSYENTCMANRNGHDPCLFNRPFHLKAETPARARYLVDSLQAAGADLIKTYDPSREVYFALMAEARRRGIPVGGHLAHGVTIQEAIDSGQRTFEHGHGTGGICWDYAGESGTLARCAALAERLRWHNAWIMIGPGPLPSSHLVTARERRARLRYWPDSVTRTMWLRDSTPENVMALAEQGLTPLAALQTATLNPAQYLEATDSLGTIARGKLADLVLLDADPLQDISNLRRIRAVAANGRYFDRAVLDSLLATVGQRGAPHWAR